jgi:hypothetical protein
MRLILIGVLFVAFLVAGCAPTASARPSPTVGPSLASVAAPSVGSTASASAGSGAIITGCNDDGADADDLTGVWNVDDGGLYYLRQMGDCVWWFGTSLREIGEGNQDGFANVAVGRVFGDELRFDWADVPLGGILGGGTLTLRIEPNGDRLVKVTESGTGFGGSTWTRREPASSASPSGEPSNGASPSSSP